MKISKKQIIIGSVIILIIVAVIFFSRSKSPAYTYFEVKRGDVIQEVNATGRVKPAEDIDLAFEKGGKIVEINIDIGNKVCKGQALARLDNSELAAQLSGARATLNSQKANLEELKNGTRPEEIQVQEVTVANASITLDDAKKVLIDTLNDALTKSDDAIRNQIDQFISNPTIQNSDFIFAVTDIQLKSNALWGRYNLETILVSWKNMIAGLNIGGDLDSITTQTNKNLSDTKTLLDDLALIVNSLTPTGSLSQTTVTTYKTSVNTARTNVNAAIANLSAAYEGYRSAKSNLSLQQNTLVLKKAGTIPEQIAAQEALVSKAEADVELYQAQLSKTVLRSPINGIITKQDAKIGEMAVANSTLVSVISADNLEVEVNAAEVDIAKVKVGNAADITLDAYGDNVIFPAKVVSIDPAEQIIDGVATYRTVLQFNNQDERIKSGMTANVDIIADKKENVLFIPQRAVGDSGGKKMVKIKVGNNVQEKEVVVGLKGSDGNLEIVSGINEGGQIVDRF